MKEYSICFLPHGIRCTAVPGETLLQVMRRAGLEPDAPCGGKGTCGKCRVILEGQEALACRTVVDRDMTVTLPQKQKHQILTQGCSTPILPDGTHDYVLAVDIGTTTVVVYLLDGKAGTVLAKESCPNPQAQYGADVISRLQYALADTADPLGECIRGCLVRLTAAVAKTAGISTEDITAAAIVGNTAMHHLLLGIDPKRLVTPPYMPKVYEALQLSNIDTLQGDIRLLPNIAGFVGGDMVGCMVAADFDKLEEMTLMIDIGTNGELVLGNKHRRIACSTAAGPAFEGAKISCGMCAVAGAVDHVWLEESEVRFHVIGDVPGVGICGSGLLDLVAVLLECGIIDDSGRMKNKSYHLEGTDVVLTQKDVREVQLAKAAIQAGIELLADRMEIELTQIRQVYLAGAFGSYMNPASACRIGMIPPCLEKRIVSIGNAAGEGAKRCALMLAEFERSKTLARQTQYLELASAPEFQNVFVDALDFPEE